jgi:hypothetical protein
MKKLRYGLIVLLLLLAACGGSDDDPQIPTEFVIPTNADTATPWPTDVPTWTPTPTVTPTATLVPTETPTVTPSMTITDTPRPTDTATTTPTADTGAISALMQLAYQATILPPDFQAGTVLAGGGPPAPVDTQAAGTGPTSCGIQPGGGFATVFTNDAAIQQQLGCPVTYHFSAASASQIFERGVMIWLDGLPNGIIVLTMDGRSQRYEDTYDASVDPVSGGETPPAGLQEPVRGFGKVWRTFPDVRNGLGWALTAETATQANVQSFQRGRMVFLPTRGDILVFTESSGALNGTWISVPGTF